MVVYRHAIDCRWFWLYYGQPKPLRGLGHGRKRFPMRENYYTIPSFMFFGNPPLNPKAQFPNRKPHPPKRRRQPPHQASRAVVSTNHYYDYYYYYYYYNNNKDCGNGRGFHERTSLIVPSSTATTRSKKPLIGRPQQAQSPMIVQTRWQNSRHAPMIEKKKPNWRVTFTRSVY
jgi:hypothetical protein